MPWALSHGKVAQTGRQSAVKSRISAIFSFPLNKTSSILSQFIFLLPPSNPSLFVAQILGFHEDGTPSSGKVESFGQGFTIFIFIFNLKIIVVFSRFSPKSKWFWLGGFKFRQGSSKWGKT
ncbi:hypothetical protein L6452_40417 [Arctium lappa]|uniref:Uncharacterized protein n=1 Tax=Arctium lappa TaxID=4217 RepID=A0ACB8XLV3_ARCLA|nr:hypothetical protein L6452_40417 [Arctium lappa]